MTNLSRKLSLSLEACYILHRISRYLLTRRYTVEIHNGNLAKARLVAHFRFQAGNQLLPMLFQKILGFFPRLGFVPFPSIRQMPGLLGHFGEQIGCARLRGRGVR